MSRVLAVHRYEGADQEGFAGLSGDFNPIHLDRAAARREYFGAVVVHGVHGLLRALETWCATHPRPLTLARVRASFPNPIHLDSDVQVVEVERGESSVRLAAECAGSPTLHADVAWREPGPGAPDLDLPWAPAQVVRTPDAPGFEALAGSGGELPLWLDRDAAGKRFPALASGLPALQLAQVLAVTRLVGMHCPGLRSILLGTQLEFAPALARGEPRLAYRVERTLRGASLVQIRVEGAGVSGTVDALYRPAPHVQPDFESVRQRVAGAELSGQAALVVGGSRGLGEVSAKLIAAGGGRVVITYQRGREDAERIAASIRAGGGRCDVLQWDSEHPGCLASELRRLELVPTHLYYFASPKIFVKRGGGFDAELCARFRAAYVDGFEALVRSCRSAGARRLRAFYPSSVALDESVKNLEEYAEAKRAGEEKCAELMRSDPLLEIQIRRLPRIATDQTLTFVKQAAADALEVMVGVVREMNGARGMHP
jgi:hypothetical protein